MKKSNSIKWSYLTCFLVISIAVLFCCQACEQDSGNNVNDENDSTNAYLLSDGSSDSYTETTFYTTNEDESAVKVTDGTLTLTNCHITKSGDTSDSDSSTAYGLNAAVLAIDSTATIAISGDSIITDGEGASAVVADGGTISISDVVIDCSEKYSRGVNATNGGSITASNLTVTTDGSGSHAIAIDESGGTVTVSGGTYLTAGRSSYILYSAGTMTASDITGTSENSTSAVVSGSGTITITNSSLTNGGSHRGILIMQDDSSATGTTGYFSMTGGSITTTDSSASLIEVVSNTTGNITFDGVTVSAASGILMEVDYSSSYETSGATGNLTLTGSSAVTGDIIADSTGTATLAINSGTTWNGAFDNDNEAKAGTITVAGGIWNLTGDSYVDTINLSGSATINKNGYTLTYTTLNNTSGTIND